MKQNNTPLTPVRRFHDLTRTFPATLTALAVSAGVALAEGHHSVSAPDPWDRPETSAVRVFAPSLVSWVDEHVRPLLADARDRRGMGSREAAKPQRFSHDAGSLHLQRQVSE